MYYVVIGLEVHCELATKSKNFSGAPNDYTHVANINVATVDLGLPGILPVANQEAFLKSLKLACALNCNHPDQFVFDRKNYFYPDLPKGFQITQMKKPIGKEGYLEFFVGDKVKKAIIHQIHLEEDTASLEHYSNYSTIDYNRSGIPLIEIVTTPCLYSSEEAVAFLEALRDLILYCEASEARTDKGQMRCDVNISLSKDEKLGTKVEIKNLNSLTNIKAAIDYEIKRQSQILDQGDEIKQETRRVGDDLKTHPMRSKVDAIDYKYFTEPNIPPFKITKKLIEAVKMSIPKLQFARIKEYIEQYGVALYDASIIAKDKKTAEYFEEALGYYNNPKAVAKWVSGVVLGALNKLEIKIDDYFIRPDMLVKVIEKIDKGELSELNAKNIIYEAQTKQIDPNKIIAEKNIKQITDPKQLLTYIEEVFNENEKQIEEYYNGKDYVANYFVGQVMKRTDKQADPKMTLELVKNELEKRR